MAPSEVGAADAAPPADTKPQKQRKPSAAKGKGKQATAAAAEADPAGDAAGAAPQAGAAGAEVAGKKKRNNNPGVRIQGGRVYDSENGTTCHQCRQKTVEVKAKCRACTLYFCPRCLENRYHERVEEVNQIEGWRCPRCRSECNCSNCRKKAGLQATGILAGVAKTAGFSSASELAAESGAPSRPASAAAPRPRPKRQASAATELADDSEFGERPAPMPGPQPVAVHKAGAGAAGGRRACGPAWASALPDVAEVPEGVCAGQLAACLELIQVFSGRLGLRSPSLPTLAAELLQPSVEEAGAQLAGDCAHDSLLAAVHCRVLEKVRSAWGVQGPVGLGAWQGIMRAYYAAWQLGNSWRLQAEHGPPAIAGELFTRPAEQRQGGEPAAVVEEGGADGAEGEGEEAAAAGGGAAPVAAVDYPAGGYFGVHPAARVQMLHDLLHDALDLFEFRRAWCRCVAVGACLRKQEIEAAMGVCAEEDKERKSELAEVRREAKEALKQQRNQQIAMLIASADGRALTLEEQRELMEAARQKAEATTNAAAAAKVQALSGRVLPPSVRANVLGEDRDGRRYLQLQTAAVLTGGAHVIVHAGPAGEAGGGARAEALGCQTDAAALAAALHEHGRREGPLRHALTHAYKLKLPKQQEQQRPEAEAGGQPAPGGGGGGDDGSAGGGAGGRGAGGAKDHPLREGSQEAEGPRSQDQGRRGSGEGTCGSADAGGSSGAKGGQEASREPKQAKRGGKRGKQQPVVEDAAAPPAEAQPAAGKRGRKRGAPPAGEQAAPADEAGPAPKRGCNAKPVPEPAAAAGGKAKQRRSGRKVVGAELPTKVDDMLVA
eukprot:scaffold28.g7601.t1